MTTTTDIQTRISDLVRRRAQAYTAWDWKTAERLGREIEGQRNILAAAQHLPENPNDAGPAITGPTHFASL